jgi:hypothetical protein
MRTFKNHSIAVTALALFGFVGSLTNPDDAGAQSPVPVRIVAPVPLPVVGNVTIAGTPTVTVGNTVANPLFGRSADNPALQPVEIGFDQTMSDGAGQTACPISVYTVPAGKTFVLEYVHLFGIGPSVPESLGFSIQGSAGDYPFVTAQRGDSQIGNLFYALTEQTRIYFGPSATVNICAFRGSVKSNFMTARATLSGYLVNVP